MFRKIIHNNCQIIYHKFRPNLFKSLINSPLVKKAKGIFLVPINKYQDYKNNRAFAELGVAQMIGGNIRYVTRMLTTSIALETAKGEIPFSIALGIILITIVLSITLLINYFRKE